MSHSTNHIEKVQFQMCVVKKKIHCGCLSRRIYQISCANVVGSTDVAILSYFIAA